jgi:hypothetical protein
MRRHIDLRTRQHCAGIAGGACNFTSPGGSFSMDQSVITGTVTTGMDSPDIEYERSSIFVKGGST